MNAPTKTFSEPLRLFALDGEDVEVLSAAMQDAIFRVADMTYLPAQRRFALVGCRFDWLAAAAGKPERTRAGLHFDSVQKAALSGFDQHNRETTLNLLGITFAEDEAPGGIVDLVFSGGAAVRLHVECIDAQLRDLGGRWPARAVPGHPLGETDK
ncbi:MULTISPECIES: DUF2948 family protein [unclassified Beijerinckia]|uniref:DUF2948 family protein n=1 Tax=unclassified Beijerinckia TaxID=2638183 RepID=UPI000895E95F|nr:MULTISPECIES: DUF2948 family protein [unclassified Beijerinckia]MDH7797775.1 hypothetical protein [Beijerinckia sp. GAS462]SEC98175.1 Protein of unknown function [Beijerinckia sp. 28-YEA-48]